MTRGRVSTLMFAAVFPALAVAQVPEAQEDFGTQEEAITVIGFTEFLPSEGVYTHRNAFGGRYLEGGPGAGGSLYAPLNMLPNGSLLTQITAYVYDNDNSPTGLAVSLCRDWVDSATGANPGLECPISMQTSGTPGDTYLQDDTDVPILYRQDIDGDGSSEIVHYRINALVFSNQAIRMVRLRWRRQVSPAPQSATFGDVPTNHQFFQFIEALSDSGITVGCQANPPLFCPDRTLTRGEMAVFLSKALGLHWPWDAQ